MASITSSLAASLEKRASFPVNLVRARGQILQHPGGISAGTLTVPNWNYIPVTPEKITTKQVLV